LKVLLLDNYDSFTHNLQHYLEQLVDVVDVKRNDAIDVQEIESYSHIVISPGPGLPAEAGVSLKLIEKYHLSKPILGVCLGFQALGISFGGELYNQNHVAHGIKRKVYKTGNDSWLLKDLPQQFDTGLYHSWALKTVNLDPSFRVSSKNVKDVIMSIEHKTLPLAGVQFHPESIMSEYGLKLLENWLEFSLKPK
jgi:anthranilate synthase component 2